MRNIFEKTRFRQANVEIEKSLILGTLNGGDKLMFGSDGIATLTADDSESSLNMVPVGSHTVIVSGVTNDANDFIVLPALAKVPNGTTIKVIGSASSNFEVRTPASSAEEINSEDCDGTKEYLFTDTQIHTFTKINNTIGWMGKGDTAIGARVTAVVPD